MNPTRAPVDALQKAMGQAMSDAIDRQGGKVAFAKAAGLNRATLYRLLSGENVSTEVLLRTLRTLGRIDILTDLTTAPAPTPLERLASDESTSRRKKTHQPEPIAEPTGGPRGPFSRLKLARPKDENDG